MRSEEPGPLLARLADLIGRAAGNDGADAAVGVVIGPDGVDLHLRTTGPGEHVAELLCGFDAPAEWDAVGIVAHGRAHRPGTDEPAQPVLVVHLQARDGRSHSLVGPVGGPLVAAGTATSGRMADLCRRCLGLPTDPPAGTPRAWWVASWLQQLCRWPGLGPATDEAALIGCFPGGRPFGPEQDLRALDAHLALLEAGCPWPLLRSAAAAGTVVVPGVPAEDAAWMDDGMFARWAMGELPPARRSLGTLQARLARPLADALTALVEQWAIDDPAVLDGTSPMPRGAVW